MLPVLPGRGAIFKIRLALRLLRFFMKTAIAAVLTWPCYLEIHLHTNLTIRLSVPLHLPNDLHVDMQRGEEGMDEEGMGEEGMGEEGMGEEGM